MKLSFYSIVVICFAIQVRSQENNRKIIESTTSGFKIAFGSCNKQDMPQPFWKEIMKNDPDLFIWGGDNIYGDSENMKVLSEKYQLQLANKGYQNLLQQIPVMATWDDHDYGKNDAGVEWKMKKQSQQLFLDFLKVPVKDVRRSQEGIYTSKIFYKPDGSVKIIILDTRYFRSPLHRNTMGKKKYNPIMKGTVLGKKQWDWLTTELNKDDVDFTVVVTSIQFLSSEHGFETWGNFPNEVEKFKKNLGDSKSKNVLMLSGDRHISEFSKTEIDGVGYTLVDFTSSGLTHAYTSFSSEPNKYRVGKVVSTPSFGILDFDFKSKKVNMKICGHDNRVIESYIQQYK